MLFICCTSRISDLFQSYLFHGSTNVVSKSTAVQDVIAVTTNGQEERSAVEMVLACPVIVAEGPFDAIQRSPMVERVSIPTMHASLNTAKIQAIHVNPSNRLADRVQIIWDVDRATVAIEVAASLCPGRNTHPHLRRLSNPEVDKMHPANIKLSHSELPANYRATHILFVRLAMSILTGQRSGIFFSNKMILRGIQWNLISISARKAKKYFRRITRQSLYGVKVGVCGTSVYVCRADVHDAYRGYPKVHKYDANPSSVIR